MANPPAIEIGPYQGPYQPCNCLRMLYYHEDVEHLYLKYSSSRKGHVVESSKLVVSVGRLIDVDWEHGIA